MSVTPTIVNFQYEKNTPFPPAQVIAYTPLVLDPNVVDSEHKSYQSDKDWVLASDFTDTNFKVSLKYTVRDLDAGDHVAKIKVYQHYKKIGHPDRRDLIGELTINLKLTQAQKTTVSPGNLVFDYTIGGTTPLTQELSVESLKSWSVTKNTNWLQLSTTSGSGSGKVGVSIIPTGLVADTYNAVVSLTDGTDTIQVPVTLNVTLGSSDYITVSKEELHFNYVKFGALPPTKPVDLFSSGDWTAVASQSWVSVSKLSGSSGADRINIGVSNLQNFDKGKYTTKVTFTRGAVVKEIEVHLEVFEFVQDLLNPSQMYFTLDPNWIQVSSSRADTHLELKGLVNYQGEEKSFRYNVPFFKSKAKKRIGAAIDKIIGTREHSSFDTLALYKPYDVLNLDLDINELTSFQMGLIQQVRVSKIPFLKGVTPKDGWMSELPSEVYYTSKGVLSFSFFNKKKESISKVVLSGSINRELDFPASSHPFYTIRLPLENLNLSVGDFMNVRCNDFQITVHIKEQGQDSTQIFWENKWGCFDSLEFTGEVIESTSNSTKLSEFTRDFNTKETKVIDNTSELSFEVNTGWLYSNEELAAIDQMVQSRRIYLLRNNQVYTVYPKVRKLPIYKTNEYLRNVKLTFINSIS